MPPKNNIHIKVYTFYILLIFILGLSRDSIIYGFQNKSASGGGQTPIYLA